MKSDRALMRGSVFVVLFSSAHLVASCSGGGDARSEIPRGTGADASDPNATTTGSNSGSTVTTTSAGSTSGGVVDLGDTPDEGDSCEVDCTPVGGQYCGEVGNGCDGVFDCGACSQSGWLCEAGLCVGGADCQPGRPRPSAVSQ